MSYYLAAIASMGFEEEPSTWGWVITKDHFAREDEDSSVGVMGPGQAPENITVQLARIQEGLRIEKDYHRARFDLYVDRDGPDDNLKERRMASGWIVWTGDAEPDEEVLVAPLHDYGQANWGCVEVRFPGNPNWDIG
ncbi:hypothetical protein CJ179_38600 [Rhodococcus sp. ACS1]|uniref:hypothetical protein n=1 Tax=Rhodococcus sp. ACS1 TaxID=2028570 RepID=UPI000BB12504|nr:hypothetical protein [Rhodococcus sp. ACS1]PBC38511.1 hypothetical protein CJ179_38600 [Rhodococcus sp. ACS1]